MARRKPIKFQDCNRADVTARPYRYGGHVARMGRSSVTITCPFCTTYVTAFLWSLAGGGKRCDCGALFGGRGQAYQWTDVVSATSAGQP